MRFLSVCSGIEAASVAWQPLGWKAVAFAEIEPFPCALLKHHYPDTPNWGDMTKYQEWPDAAIDLLCGGTPCQSFSVAGLRRGLDDPRGNLMLTFGAIAAKYRPEWLVWENVPGVLSSNGGRDFGAFLGMLGQLGYGFAYRVLDAQYFGVAQRRRRVFVVGCAGDWRRAAAVLFERHSLQGHPAPRRQTRQVAAGGVEVGFMPSSFGGYSEGVGTLRKDGGDYGGGTETLVALDVAGTMKSCKESGGWSNSADHAAAGYMVPVPHADISPALKARDYKSVSSDGDGDGAIIVPMASVAFGIQGTMPTLRAGATNGGSRHGARSGDSKDEYIVPCITVQERGRADGPNLEIGGDVAFAPTAPNGGGRAQERNALSPSMQVRRLTPAECEALQGFPRDYTLIPIGKKMAADGPRYKALGNSWAVPNARWIGERLQAVADIPKTNSKQPASALG